MTADVEQVARLLAESEGHTWHPWFADQYGEDYRKQARAAMAVTRKIDADALRAEALQQEIAGRCADAQGMEAAADWLQQRANDVKEAGNG